MYSCSNKWRKAVLKIRNQVIFGQGRRDRLTLSGYLTNIVATYVMKYIVILYSLQKPTPKLTDQLYSTMSSTVNSSKWQYFYNEVLVLYCIFLVSSPHRMQDSITKTNVTICYFIIIIHDIKNKIIHVKCQHLPLQNEISRFKFSLAWVSYLSWNSLVQ